MTRIRLSRRGKTTATAVAARDTDLEYLWRQRLAVETQGLPTKRIYVSPDGSNVYVGEDVVVANVVESMVLEDSVAIKKISNDTSDVDGKDEGTTASDIGTTVQISQGTLNNLFGTSSESKNDLWQATVARAFDLPPEHFLLNPSELEEATVGGRISH
ncbi:hypothetical protein PHMEG_00014697 [Phytophthora megakarya]|uniref:Uncharacterized protein n=1 Tax=Phytophthora megakarya TaxID=4795 RepID=A0A225W4P4_9STRA|nr:hypothetical protein PHMEG_00014697 [Phytophthora megakarya]